ncbi:glycosyltransferase family protein [Caloranaerobacter ferrireducens]|uniref:glycosyltransferase family protein n=1 Tax=Caloranaerobacter ferrireducens TaxID=1323370 RepID=UPI000B32F6E2|nr:glycosyltransferase [Caloranaerobacter ferrireducens]
MYNKACKITNPNLKIACILDEISYECFKYECKLIPLGVYDWKNTLECEKPDLLLVESAWNGINNQWINKIADLHRFGDTTLKKIVDWCKKNKIPTVFWNKEDPVNFKRFINAAKLFDYIFTTDAESIPKYKELIGNNHVYTLPFAAQPKIHNPINKDTEKLGKVAFAGSWYAKGHEKRKEYMNIILKPAFQYDLHIYDRNYNNKHSLFKFPYEYQPYIIKGLPYKEMSKIYKRYDVFLNVNSVENSSTMFSRRVFELLACGTNIISSYSKGIEIFFPNIVKMCKTQEDTKKYLKILLKDKELRDKLSLLGQREIFKKHTYKHRLKTILVSIGVNTINTNDPGVSIITCTKRFDFISNIIENFNRQKYVKKELIIILNNNNINLCEAEQIAKQYENIRVFQLNEEISSGECLNFGIEQSKFEIISKFDDSDYYAPDYLVDIINAYSYTDAEIIGKCSYYIYFEDSKILAIKHPNNENMYTKFIKGSTLTFKKEIFNKVKFPNKSSNEDIQFLKNCINNSFKIYSTDRFNYVYIRHNCTNEHTWKIQNKDLLKECIIINSNIEDYKSKVTV